MDLVYLVNLPLGVFWLFLGGAILIYESIHGPVRWRPLDVSPGWWFLLLSLYNWSKVARALWAKRQPAEPPVEVPESTLARRDHRPLPTEPPDPNFQFRNQPPPEPK